MKNLALVVALILPYSFAHAESDNSIRTTTEALDAKKIVLNGEFRRVSVTCEDAHNSFELKVKSVKRQSMAFFPSGLLRIQTDYTRGLQEDVIGEYKMEAIEDSNALELSLRILRGKETDSKGSRSLLNEPTRWIKAKVRLTDANRISVIHAKRATSQCGGHFTEVVNFVRIQGQK